MSALPDARPDNWVDRLAPVRLRPWRVHPGDALRNEPRCPRCKRGGNEVPRSLATHAGVAPRAFSHPGGIKTGREISQLMHHDIRPGSADRWWSPT